MESTYNLIGFLSNSETTQNTPQDHIHNNKKTKNPKNMPFKKRRRRLTKPTSKGTKIIL